MRVGEVEPEQVGKILDRRLGARWIRSRQRRDGVHAVEQEVRLDACLKRADPCSRLELDVAAPLVRDVEVPQRQRPDDRRDAYIGQQELPVLTRENSRGHAELAFPGASEPVGGFGNERDGGDDQAQCD